MNTTEATWEASRVAGTTLDVVRMLTTDVFSDVTLQVFPEHIQESQ